MLMNVRILAVLIGLVQIFDVVIHVATGQVEPLRIASNVVVLAWVVLAISIRIPEAFRSVTVGSIGTYLVLNGVFLAREGFVNPDMGGDPRTVLLLLVLATAILGGLATALHERKR